MEYYVILQSEIWNELKRVEVLLGCFFFQMTFSSITGLSFKSITILMLILKIPLQGAQA